MNKLVALSKIGRPVPELPVEDVERAQQYYRDVLGFEIGWGIAREFRGKGYAVEAAQASIDWAFTIFEIDRIIHCIDRENLASQAVARRLGAEKSREMNLFGHAADVWVTERDAWMARRKE